MPVEQSLVGREFPTAKPYAVSAEKIAEFATATGSDYAGGDAAAPATFPIVLAFDAMFAFLDAESIELARIVHGDQKFSYARPVRAGDVLSATLTVTSLRQIGGNDIIGTTSAISDADGELVCTTAATLVHRGADS